MQALANYLTQHSKKALIFDFDETLFTLELPWHIFFNGLVERLRVLDPALHEEKSIATLEHRAIKQHGEEANTIITDWSNEFERQYLQGITEHLSMTNFLREEHNKYQFFLWTSNMRATVEPVLREAGLLELFERMVTADDVLFIKPDPEGFSLIRTGEAPLEDYLMIGDSTNDQGAAAAAGIDFFQVTLD